MRAWKSPVQIDDNGHIVIVTDLDALRQKIIQRLEFFKGTWFLNTNIGVPWLQEILKIPSNEGLAASIINTEIMKESGVISIGAVETGYNSTTRSFTYTSEINTIYGTTEVTF